MSERFCVLFDGAPVAEPTCISMAVVLLVAGLYVFNIEHPKNCEHFLRFTTSHLLGIKYDKGNKHFKNKISTCKTQ